ncbi:MAG: tRNA dihydrouridine synthase DusB [Gammaproteobacteria bacterium]|nr:tRNA dihydrouridine synthase DusB [Gammaproteobacteria bacterium]
MRIGHYKLHSKVIAAPMAGITDQPFRRLCRSWGAGLAVSEMVASKPELRGTKKTILRCDHDGEPEPVAVQIVGADPAGLADAARYNVDLGAQIIDINMGCPAKKVCNVYAGAALLEHEQRVAQILEAVVDAVDVPVTLKMRTGPTPEKRNGVRIAKLAEAAGVQALAVHGRSRACRFGGAAEYRTIRAIKHEVSIPVIANGDIRTAEQAAKVLRYTEADAVMIGRAAQGAPWIFQQISHYLSTGENLDEPDLSIQRDALLRHLEALYEFYGEARGLRVARKHIRWYTSKRVGGDELWRTVNRVNNTQQQYRMISEFFRRPRAPIQLAA